MSLLVFWTLAAGLMILMVLALHLSKMDLVRVSLLSLVVVGGFCSWSLLVYHDLGQVAWHLGLSSAPTEGLAPFPEVTLAHVLPLSFQAPFQPEVLRVGGGMEFMLELGGEGFRFLADMSVRTYWTAFALVGLAELIGWKWWKWHHLNEINEDKKGGIVILGMVLAHGWPGIVYVTLLFMLGLMAAIQWGGWWLALGALLLSLPPLWKALDRIVEGGVQAFQASFRCLAQRKWRQFPEKLKDRLSPRVWGPKTVMGWMMGLLDRPIIWKLLRKQQPLDAQQKQELRNWGEKTGNHRALNRYIQRARKLGYQDFLEALTDPAHTRLLYQRALGSKRKERQQCLQQLIDRQPHQAWKLIQQLGGVDNPDVNAVHLARLLNHAHGPLRQQIIRSIGTQPADKLKENTV